MKFKSALTAIAFAAVLGVQSTSSFAQQDYTWVRNTPKFGVQVGMCSSVPWGITAHWPNWIPCVMI
jgi:hypothetical protein